jgi:lysophospholipase L1-like esterase
VINKSGLLVLGVAALAAYGSLSPSVAQNANQNWVAAWATSQQGLSETKLSNATVRMIARVTIPGDAVRIRLDNTFGTAPLTIAHATLAPRVRGPAVAVGQVKPISFGGKATVTIPAGQSAESDAVALHVDAQQDLAISLFVPGANVQPSQHGNAQTTSYVTDNGGGDQAMSEDGKAFGGKTTSMYWVKSIDVRPAAAAAAIVAFGDSITDGTCTTLDAHDRWEDVVAQRLALNNQVNRAVINEGIGGNTILNSASYNPAINSPPGVERLDRDVLSHPGVSHVILFEGTNDIRRGASAEQVMAGIKVIVERVHAKNLRIIGATIIPRHNQPDDSWNDAKSKVRRQVNDYIKKGAGFDAVLDFDAIVKNPAKPDELIPAYNCGDGIHPSPLGYFLMGKSVELGLFGAK